MTTCYCYVAKIIEMNHYRLMVSLAVLFMFYLQFAKHTQYYSAFKVSGASYFYSCVKREVGAMFQFRRCPRNGNREKFFLNTTVFITNMGR